MNTSQQSLINKYRPATFEAVLGNEACIKALMDAVRGPTQPHSYLFTGSSGIGKTTLARIIANEVGAVINEIDAASKSGVDNTRELVDMSGFQPLQLDGKKNVLHIIDECFAPGSLVDTPVEKIPIEFLKKGDLIINALGSAKVKRVLKNWVDISRVLILTLEDGTIIVTTKEHAFLTGRGWIATKNLQVGETLTNAREMVARTDLQQELLGLWDPMQEKFYDSRAFSEKVLQSTMWIKGKDFFKQGREWEADSPSAAIAEINKSSDRTSYSNKFSKRPIQVFTLPLQCGSGACRIETSNRSGREYASTEETTLDRSQKDGSFRSFRVASIQSLESGSNVFTERCCQTRVINNRTQALFYDLQVDKHPSYSVEGILVHNCGSFSQKAWEPLLKLIEEPPPFLYIALCTTEAHKVPKAIVTRSYPVALRPLKAREIEDLVSVVSELEGWTVADGVFQAIVQASQGSARLALNILQAGHAAKDRNELSQIIVQVDSDINPAIKICTLMMKGQKNWKGISQLLEEIDGNEEEAITSSANYIAGALVRSDEAQAQEYYRMLRAFTETETWNKKIHYYTAIGKCLWGQEPF